MNCLALRIVSWNVNRNADAWRVLAVSDFDVGLLQEASAPPPDIVPRIEVEEEVWEGPEAGYDPPWRSTVIQLSDRVRLRPYTHSPVDRAGPEDMRIGRFGTLAVADIEILSTGELLTVASMYGAWERPVSHAGKNWIYADASVHRIISDLSALIGSQRGHRMIAAGDLNVLYGYGEDGSPYWKARYDTIFARMEALGLAFVGPQAPQGGEQASPWPDELPTTSKNVPTYRKRISDPASATRQLDFVFVSQELKKRVIAVSALNSVDNWGPSDHCRISIELS